MEENLAAKLCLFLGDQANEAIQWKLLGQEKDGSLLLVWVENSKLQRKSQLYSVIGRYDRVTDDFKILNKFSETLNIVQATVNQQCSVLGYITKVQDPHEPSESYQAHLVELKTENPQTHTLITNKFNQIRMQFLYRGRAAKNLDKLLVLIHQEGIQTYTIYYDITSDLSIKELKSESLVKSFVWAQWDLLNQVLYYIYYKKPLTSLFSDAEKSPKPAGSSPTLSGLQFHDDLPHETVLNIPLNLPQAPDSNTSNGIYEDDVIPLRVHDCSLDLIVISDTKGTVCVCHHYLYSPSKDSLSDSNAVSVHFAYSVTVLHQSSVIHCNVPGIPWTRAKLIRPTFVLYGDNHMIVFAQGFFTHLLEIGSHHQPCCHVLCGPLTNVPLHASYLVPLIRVEGNNSILTVDLPTLDLIKLTVPSDFLIDTFRKVSSTEVRLAIMHYFVCHSTNTDSVGELVSGIAEKPRALDNAKIMQEFLVSGSHAFVQKNLPADAIPLLSLVPVTTMDGEETNLLAKINDLEITLSHEKLWNTSVMLLSPQQRLVPYRSDLWTRLWDLLNMKSEDSPRFKPGHTVEKLLVSLACYQPEALSRCSTPMSPGGGFSVSTATLGELIGRYKYENSLPFNEMENCTASKQEHIISVNLRELSLHLLQYGTQNNSSGTRSRIGSCTPMQAHALATRHATAQLEISRLLCQMLCKAANVDARMELERGFPLIDQLDDFRRWLLFTLLERYRHATDGIAYPVPQGFMSFFTYLGYRTLKYTMFLQHVRHSVFELQVDVAKVIIADIGNSKQSVPRKLELLSLLPRTRAKRLLNQWQHPLSLMLRAREHAANILSGELMQSRNRVPQYRLRHTGVSAFPCSDRLSPLDTFLDLLTAKASLTELDFGLLIEATIASTEDFL